MKKDDMSEAFKKVWEKIKNLRFVLIVVAAGVVLLMLPDREGSAKADTEIASYTQEFSLEEEQRRIAAALEEIDGAGKVTVVLTLKTGTETVVAEDTQSTYVQDETEGRRETEAKTVIVSRGSSVEDPVVLKYIYPEYQGALVVAEGAGNAEIRLSLTKAVAGLTGLSSDAINIVKMK